MDLAALSNNLYTSDRVLMPNNLQEYSDPLLYDAEYGSYCKDIPFFSKLIPNGKVLDLACGTGRLSIALAKTGFEVTGLDLCEPMLNLARNKSQGLDIQYLLGDISNFNLKQTFDLIVMAGNAFQALLTIENQKAMLACVKRHLKAGGTFAFDTRNPKAEDLVNTSSKFIHWHSFTDPDGIPVKVFGKCIYAPDTQIASYTTKRVWPSHETFTKIQLRYTSCDQLLELLKHSGFETVSIHGDFQKSPWTNESPSMVAVCCTVASSQSYKLITEL